MNRGSHATQTRSVRIASLSDVGRVRSVNEDSYGEIARADGSRLLVVADGMGGHRGGATASREAVATISAIFTEGGPFDPQAALVTAIERANARIFDLAAADPELAGMGTTVVAFLLDATGRGTVAHVGDSRCYRMRNRVLEALTTDHSVVAEMLRRGILTPEQAAVHPRRNEILRSVGVLPEVEVECAPVEVVPGDWILLCSDGLCGVVSDAEIDLVLANARSPEDAASALVELANESGGPDNVTVQLLVVPATDGAEGGGAKDSPESSEARSATDSQGEASRVARPGLRIAAVIAAALLLVAAYWIVRTT